MKENKKSETLSQRNKAQKDIIELNLMREGKMETGPKPSETAIKPNTFWEKTANFFYHHKLKVIIGLVVAIILCAGIYSSITKTSYDAKVALFCYDNTIGLYAKPMEEYLTKFFSDRNSDGKVKIAVANCSYDKNNIQSNEGVLGMSKLQSILAGEKDCLLFIVSKDTIDYLNSISKEVVFFTEENIHKLSDDFINSVKTEGLKELEGEYYIALRATKGTAIENGAEKYYPTAKEAFDRIKSAN